MKKYNVLLGYCPVYGKDLAKALVKEENVSLCYQVADEYCYDEDGIVYFNRLLGENATYEKVFDLNQMPALSKELLEQMLPYESMALNLGMRTTNFPIVNYEEEKCRYYKHLRFWNYILDNYEINAMFFEETPHRAYTYIIYALALVKDIPILMCNVSSIPGLRIFGSRIENLGCDIQDYYAKVCKDMDADKCIMSGKIEEFVQKYTQPIAEIKKERKDSNVEKKELKRVTDLFYGKYLGISNRLLPVKNYCSRMVKVLKGEKNWEWYEGSKEDIKILEKECCDIRTYMKHAVITQKEYNKFAVEPDYSKKYIYFALQLTPEETTMPRAGVFSSQYNSIQLLARAAKENDVMVYVKEHYVQTFRSRYVYEQLKKIPNVRLIKTTVSSFDLIQNCVAVATQTGTCILEGALRGKPALVTSSGALWKGLPSMFEIIDEKQGAKIIENIIAGYDVSREEVLKYFYAIQENAMECYYEYEWWKQRDKKEHHETVNRLLKRIQRFLME